MLKKMVRYWLVVLMFVTHGCGARTEPPSPERQLQRDDLLPFVGRWNGSDEALGPNHPLCTAMPNVDEPGRAVDRLCTTDISIAPNGHEMVAIIDVGGGLDRFISGERLGILPVHRLRLDSPRHAVFGGEVAASDAGGEFGLVTGTATLEGDTLVLRFCGCGWHDFAPGCRNTTARECRLRRIR